MPFMLPYAHFVHFLLSFRSFSIVLHFSILHKNLDSSDEFYKTAQINDSRQPVFRVSELVQGFARFKFDFHLSSPHLRDC